MEQIKAIKTEIGEIHGRDAIFLDDIQFNYQKNEVKLIGEISGSLCTESDNDEFIGYELLFKKVATLHERLRERIEAINLNG